MRGRNGILRYLVAFMLLLGLLAGSLNPVAAEDDASEATPVGEATSTEEDTSTSSEEEESDLEEATTGDAEAQLEAQSELVTTQDTTSQVSINLSSTDPDAASTMPAGSTWTVTTTDGTFVDDGVFAEEHLNLPVTIAVESPVPYGDYLVSINALPVFRDYQHSHVINMPVQTVNVPLEPAESPAETSQVTLNVSSSDGTLADIMPEGSTWTLSGTSGEGTVASGEFSGDQLQLPTSVVIGTPIPYGEYLVTVNATWAFEPYEFTHLVNSPTQMLDIVLDPYVEQPVASSVSVVLEDGSEADVSMRWAIDNAESGDNIAGGNDTYSIPTTLWEGELMPGDYWVSIYPDGDYAAISEKVTVTPRVPTAPFEFTLVPTGPEPTAEPTAEPTHDDKHDGDKDKDHKHKKDKKEKEDVTTLPSTGQGSDSGSGGGLMALTLGGISLLLMAASFAWRPRRTEA